MSQVKGSKSRWEYICRIESCLHADVLYFTLGYRAVVQPCIQNMSSYRSIGRLLNSSMEISACI